MEDLMTVKNSLAEIPAQVYQQPLAAFIPQINKGAEVLSKIETVNDTASLETANEYLQKAKTLQSLIVKKVEEMCRPLKDLKTEADAMQRKIKEYADEIHQPIGRASQALQAKILAYHTVCQIEADRVRKINEDMVKEQQEKLRAAEEAKKKAESQDAAKGEEIPEPPAPEPPPVIIASPVIRPPKVKGMTTIWKYEIENEEQIPRTYLAPDLSKINAAVKGGCRQIPGIRIYPEQTIKKA